jgi:hypothetical protein
MAKVMVNIHTQGEAPTLQSVRERFGLRGEEIDSDFGVIEVDEKEGVYTILVDERAAAKLSGDARWKVTGPFPEGRIAPMGPT